MPLWDTRLGTTLVQLVLLQLSESRGRAQSVLGRKGRLSPHFVLGCLLVIWLTGEGVILLKLSLVKSCFSDVAAAGKGKMGLLTPRWHTLEKVVANQLWGKPGKLLWVRTGDWRPPEVGHLVFGSSSERGKWRSLSMERASHCGKRLAWLELCTQDTAGRNGGGWPCHS